MAKRFSRILKGAIGIVIVLLVLVAVVNIAGLIGDRSIAGDVSKAGRDALQYFADLQKDGKGNAWDYYVRAMDAAEGISSDRELMRYLDGEEEPSFKLMTEILDNLLIIAQIKEGARQDYCAIPLAYEEGINAELPEYVALRRVVSITCVKALYDLEHGRNEEALDLLFSALMVGKHVASSPMIIDQMVGFALVGRALKVLEIGIASRGFNQRQLEEIAGFLDDMEKHWPPLANAISGELKLNRISFAKHGQNVTSLMVMGNEGIEESGFIRTFVLRILCWRDWFSPIRSIHKSFLFFEELHETLSDYEDLLLDETIGKELEAEKRSTIEKKIADFRKRNFWFALACPEYTAMFKRKMEWITTLRMLNLSSSLASHRLKTGSFPEKLTEIAPHLLVDLQTRKPWKYLNYGDSASISSPRIDEEPDMVITVTNMSIGTYLENKRLRAQKEREDRDVKEK
jgi:hypothetical protein